MKKQVLLFLLVCTVQFGFSQCYPDRHNTSWFDGWLSCETCQNPNAVRGESHWISYDFGQPYELNELKIWNVNDPDLLDDGAHAVAIDYSLDGINWFSHTTAVFPKASGISTYEGDIILNFSGLKVRYLLFTVLDNYGGTCSGFSEMRVSVKSAKDENADLCMLADIFPNPFQTEFTVLLTKKCLGDVHLAIEDATGRTVSSEKIINLNDPVLINGNTWTPGIYFVCLRNGDLLERYKIVKF